MTPREAKLQTRAELAEAKLARMRLVLLEVLWLVNLSGSSRIPQEELTARWDAVKEKAGLSLDESVVDR